MCSVSLAFFFSSGLDALQLVGSGHRFSASFLRCARCGEGLGPGGVVCGSYRCRRAPVAAIYLFIASMSSASARSAYRCRLPRPTHPRGGGAERCRSNSVIFVVISREHRSGPPHPSGLSVSVVHTAPAGPHCRHNERAADVNSESKPRSPSRSDRLDIPHTRVSCNRRRSPLPTPGSGVCERHRATAQQSLVVWALVGPDSRFASLTRRSLWHPLSVAVLVWPPAETSPQPMPHCPSRAARGDAAFAGTAPAARQPTRAASEPPPRPRGSCASPAP